ncbi:Neutral protease 2 [Beauveria bassiana D1-5]|uniref:Neutral protease 2 n=1 Tax=Beauveria bassiana D1-5 TaxID=1245745 RepID=A0A0A2VGQ1_BEABA|nr:Neutral protease 2 [Beauveria bassiana D1-5]
MRFFTLAAALTSVATAAPSAARSALDVKIESAGNSGQVKTTITKTGKDNLKIFRHGTIFDNAHTEKAAIEANGSNVEFQGLRLRLSTDNLTDFDFQKIDAGQRQTGTIHALRNCASLSNKAAQAAKSGSAAKVEEYFKSSSASTRSAIVNVFNKVAQECGSTSGGASRYYCTDQFDGCGSRVLAYTQPSRSLQDQATTTLHETTHLREVAGTADNGYGYDNIRKLTTAQSLNNADSYAMFANAIYAGC